MLLNNLRNKEQEHKDIKNILEKDYGYTIKSPVYGNSAKKVLQQVQDAKQELYRNFTVEEYNRVVLFEKYLQQLIELDANKWGKGNPNVGGAMALDPNWAGGLRGAGMGAEVTQGHASADEVKKWLGTSDGKIFVNRAKTHGDDVGSLLKDPELMGMAPAGLMSSIAVANGVRLGLAAAPALAAIPGAGWIALVAIGVVTVGIIAYQIHTGKEQEAIKAEVKDQSKAITTVTGEKQKDWSAAFFQPGEDPHRDGRTTDRTTGRSDPVMSQDGELDPNAGKRNDILKTAVVGVSTEIKLGDPNALKDKAAHMNAADKINTIMGSMYRDLADIDPEGGADYDDPTTGARLTVSDPKSQFGVSQKGVEVPIDRTKASDAIPQTGVSQADISSAIATFKAAETDKAVSATAAAIAGTDIKYDDQGMMAEPTGRADVDRSEWVTPDMKVADPAVLRAKQDYMDKGDAAAQRALAIAHSADQRTDIEQGKAPPLATNFQHFDTGVHDAPEDDPRADSLDKDKTKTGIDTDTGINTGTGIETGTIVKPKTGTVNGVNTGTITVGAGTASTVNTLARAIAATNINTNSRTRSGKKGGKKRPKGGILPKLGAPTISTGGHRDTPEPRGQTFGALGGRGIWPYGKTK